MQFVNCSVKDLEKENPITKQEIVKEDEKNIYVKTLHWIENIWIYVNITT